MNQIQYSHVAGDFEFGRHKLLPRCCKALEIDFLLWPGSTRICIDCMEWWWLQQKGCSSGLCQQSPFQFESFDGSISKINFVTELKKYTPEVSSHSSDYFQKLCLVHEIHWFGCKRIADGLCHHCIVPNFSAGRCWNSYFTQLKTVDIDVRQADYHFGNSKTNILVWKNRFYNKNCASTKALKFTMYQSFDIFEIVKSVNKLFSWYIKSHETRVDTAISKSRNNFSPKKKKCRITLKKVLFAIKCGT